MPVAAYPLAKIGILLLKQLSKPLANIIKTRAKRHPIIRRKIIIPTGKAFRWIENRAALKRGEIPEPLSEEEAVELGANAIGEIILFGILTMILLYEINRQGDKKAEIQKLKDDELANLKDLTLDLFNDISKLRKTIRKIQNDMKLTADAVDMEERMHTAVYDFDFLDVSAKRRRRNEEENFDEVTPSW